MILMRQITFKDVQVHIQCICGYNCVDHDRMHIRWKDLSRVGILRKKDRATRKPFLLLKININNCNCYHE